MAAETHLVLEDGWEFDMEVAREPVLWLQLLEQLLSCPGTKSVVLYLRPKVLLEPHEPLLWAMVVDASRPVVGHKDVVVPRQLFETEIYNV